MAARVDEAHQLATLKAHMPTVLGMVRDRAKVQGNRVYALVRRGMRGESGCFFAFEGGHVVGTPFRESPDIMGDVASAMVSWGVRACVIWPDGAAT